MKTLVIHPDDRSTDFLSKIYRGKDWTVINSNTRDMRYLTFEKLLNEHDRIIMMGHGGPNGLFYSRIDERVAHILRKKICVCIWCNADIFVRRYKLNGFYTGMFISEVGEARWYNIDTTQEQIDFSNHLFTDLVTENIDNPTVHSTLKESYNSETCPVIQFNNERLYFQPLDLLDEMLKSISNDRAHDRLN